MAFPRPANRPAASNGKMIADPAAQLPAWSVGRGLPKPCRLVAPFALPVIAFNLARASTMVPGDPYVAGASTRISPAMALSVPRSLINVDAALGGESEAPTLRWSSKADTQMADGQGLRVKALRHMRGGGARLMWWMKPLHFSECCHQRSKSFVVSVQIRRIQGQRLVSKGFGSTSTFVNGSLTVRRFTMGF
jgi:hypothetical protein